MVVQRTLAKIEELKERPHHERRAIATYGAYGVAGLLVLSWGFFSINNFAVAPQAVAVEDGTGAQSASAASALGGGAQTANTTMVASSTNGRVELVPASEIGQEI